MTPFKLVHPYFEGAHRRLSRRRGGGSALPQRGDAELAGCGEGDGESCGGALDAGLTYPPASTCRTSIEPQPTVREVVDDCAVHRQVSVPNPSRQS